jgi:acetyl-CoA synthetase
MIKQLSLQQVLECGIESEEAIGLLPQINQWLVSLSAAECWQHLTRFILRPDHPFALHSLLHQITFADWRTPQGPPPAWFPTPEQIETTHIAALMRQFALPSYSALHTWSVQNRSAFWELMVQRLGIRCQHPYTQVMDASEIESPQWLVNARFNIVESCFQALENATAIVFQPEEGSLETLTYGQLQSLANQVANGLVNAGFQPGDAIAIDMPMTPTAVAIYLGIIQMGGIVVSIADSFAAAEIAARLRLAQAKAIFTQDVIQRSGKQLPLYAKVVGAQAPMAIVLAHSSSNPANPSNPALQLRSGDLTWTQFLSPNSTFEPRPTHAAAPINILFSSGTTGDPKAIPWSQTTPIKCAADGHLHQDIHPGDVVAWSTSLGWMMGPWLIFATLINRATIALYGGTPACREYGQFIQDAGVTMLGVVPSLVSHWRTSQCMHGLDWSAIKAFSSTGECSNPQDMLFLMSLAGYRPIVEYCGGTEIGGAYITGTLVQPCAPATFTTPALGLEIVILDSDDRPADQGEGFIIPPSIGLSTELLNKDHHQVYFAHTPPFASVLRRHGDYLQQLPNGYYRLQGRVDDTMNLGGIKVSSAEIEQAVNRVPEICETAAIALAPAEGGPSQLVIFAVVRPGTESADLKPKLQAAIAQYLNPLFKIRDLVIVEALPRTASNKVMRRLLRQQYWAAEQQPVPAIAHDDPMQVRS